MTSSATGPGTRSSRSSPTNAPTSRRSRPSIRPACRQRRASSGTWRSTTSGCRSSRPTRSGSGHGARWRLDTVGDGLFLLFARDHAPLPERLAAIAGRLEARAGLPRAVQVARVRAPGPALAGDGDRDRQRAPGVHRRDRCRGRGTCRPPERRRLSARRRGREGGRRAVRDLAGGHARGRHRRVADRARTPRRDGRPARLRRTGRGRDPRARLGAARRGARRRGSATAREIDPDAWTSSRHRSGQGGRPGRLRRSARWPIGTRCSGRAQHLIERDLVTSRPTSGSTSSPTPEYLRSVLPFAAYFAAGRLRRRSQGDLRRHAVGRTATRTR